MKRNSLLSKHKSNNVEEIGSELCKDEEAEDLITKLDCRLRRWGHLISINIMTPHHVTLPLHKRNRNSS
jgi:hypothetical protein